MLSYGRLSLRATLRLFWSLPLCAVALMIALRQLLPFETTNDPAILFALPAVAYILAFAGLHARLGKIRSSMQSLKEGVEAVGRGDVGHRVARQTDPECDALAGAINRMAENVAADMAAESSQKKELHAVLNGMREGVMVLDTRCRIQRVNRAMERILPGAVESLGRSPLELLPSPELLDACERVASGRGEELQPLLVVLDERRIYEVNVLRPTESNAFGVIAVFHDVSDIKRLESVRRDFAANVSHELRTPLTSIKGYAETLLSDMAPPPEMTTKFLRVILRNADHMSKMIGDLLSLARLEADGTALSGPRGVPLDARVSLQRAWEAAHVMAAARQITLSDEMPECLPRVMADEDQLVQVFRNLLENAVKFGPEARPILVRFRTWNNFAEFTLRDFGPGIPKKDQSRIFERFYSVEKHRRNDYGSTGLGLAITRHIIHNHGGTIRVESPPAGHLEGTAFIFTLPLV